MLRELTREDWLRILDLPADRVPRVLLLRGTRNLKHQYAQHAKLFTNVLEVGSPNGILEDVLVGDLSGVPAGYASVYGAAMASEVAHVFGVLGTELVLLTGCCGALAEGIGPGDLVIPTQAFCGEGAAQHYVPGRSTVRASLDLREASAPAAADGWPVHHGPIYTTGALLAEGRDEVEDWSRRGFIAVDLETAAVFAVAQHFGMSCAAVLFAFDNPRHEADLVLEDEAKDARRREGERRMIEVALAAVRGPSGR